ncbi:hypothetical protein XH89_19585 [Bradyrhizobium sp. CCBAU 53340]|nr:hypothetical protein XH89_19585 [Bradyrhizobium sp. CCBAU 53340]
MALQAERIEAAHVEAVADMEAGRVANDADRVADAADRILVLDATRQALATRANRYFADLQQQPKGSQFGLSQDEVEIANASGLSEQEYAENRDRLRMMRATGRYRDQFTR